MVQRAGSPERSFRDARQSPFTFLISEYNPSVNLPAWARGVKGELDGQSCGSGWDVAAVLRVPLAAAFMKLQFVWVF